MLCGIHGEQEIRVLDIESKKQVLKIEIPILPNAVKSIENGWVFFSGMNTAGIVMYNIYKDTYYPAVFKYSKATVHGILYFERKKLLIIAGNEAYFVMYKFHQGISFGS
jgi:hypothetical protein